MGVKQLRNSSTINNINNTSTKQILVSAWTVETHTHTNAHKRATKLRVTDSQKERSSTERESVREADESRQECWKQCKTIFLKNINLQSSSHVLRVFTSQQTSKNEAAVTRRRAERQDEIKQTEAERVWRPTRSWDLYLDVEAEESAISQLLVWKSQIGPGWLLINLSDDCETQLHCSTDSRHLWLFGKHVTFAVCFILDVVIGLDYLVWCYWFVLDSSFCLVYQSVKIRKD